MNKFKRKDQTPLCACGCGERVKKSQDHEGWNKFIAYHSNRGKYNPMYGRNRSGKNHPLYGKKGIDNPNTRKIGSKMYTKTNGILIKTINGWKSEHTIIAEVILERKLKSKEMVHHIDGNSFNNNYNNLLICTIGYHCGIHNKIRGQLGWKHSKETRQKMSINATDRKMSTKSGKRAWAKGLENE